MFWHFYQNPKVGEVYNVGGGRHSNCSILEAIDQIQIITGKKIKNKYKNEHRKGDHIWWISNIDKFRKHYPDWEFSYDFKKIISEIASEMLDR